MVRRLHKIRIIQSWPKGGVDVIGLSIPSELRHWIGTLVTVAESGNCIILTSGARAQPITNKELLQHSIQKDFVRI